MKNLIKGTTAMCVAGYLTVFAPTDAAFNALATQLNLTNADALGDGAVEGRDGRGERGLGAGGVALGDELADGLHQRTKLATDATVAVGALDALTVALLSGCMIGHEESSTN